ncbi:MAG: hypothetical protein JXA52_04620 [Planctomycetes bacterium]|nr:hypothetical protein [Planctomycetota bacterium]
MEQPAFPKNQPSQPEPLAAGEKPGWQRLPAGIFRPRGLLEEIRFLSGIAFLLILAFIIFGWLSGSIYKGVQDYSEQQALIKSFSSGVLDAGALLRVAERKANLNPEDPQAQMVLANLYYGLTETDRFKGDAQAFYLEAEVAANRAWAIFAKLKPEEAAQIKANSPAFKLRYQQANILAQVGRDRVAAELYSELVKISKDEKTYLRANLLNSLAWLLATTADPKVRDLDTAQELSIKCIKLLPEASRNAAFLDTLAMTYYLKGDSKQAVKVQKEALARAPGSELYLLLQNYDLFKSSAVFNNPN